MRVLDYIVGLSSVLLGGNVDEKTDNSMMEKFLDYDSSSSSNTPSYDYYMFRMQFPGSYCQTSSCDSAMVEKLQPNTFKIHGFWPSATTGTQPEECQSIAFNEDELTSETLSSMNTNWPSDQGANTGFWSHEWTKHGVCAEDVPGQANGYMTEEEFFAFVLAQYNSVDATGVLADAQIVPSNSEYYHLSDINSAFQGAYGVTPTMSCQYEYESGKSWLMNMSLCYDLELNYMACPGVETNCRSTDKIYMGAYENSQ